MEFSKFIEGLLGEAVVLNDDIQVHLGKYVSDQYLAEAKARGFVPTPPTDPKAKPNPKAGLSEFVDLNPEIRKIVQGKQVSRGIDGIGQYRFVGPAFDINEVQLPDFYRTRKNQVAPMPSYYTDQVRRGVTALSKPGLTVGELENILVRATYPVMIGAADAAVHNDPAGNRLERASELINTIATRAKSAIIDYAGAGGFVEYMAKSVAVGGISSHDRSEFKARPGGTVPLDALDSRDNEDGYTTGLVSPGGGVDIDNSPIDTGTYSDRVVLGRTIYYQNAAGQKAGVTWLASNNQVPMSEPFATPSVGATRVPRQKTQFNVIHRDPGFVKTDDIVVTREVPNSGELIKQNQARTPYTYKYTYGNLTYTANVVARPYSGDLSAEPVGKRGPIYDRMMAEIGVVPPKKTSRGKLYRTPFDEYYMNAKAQEAYYGSGATSEAMLAQAFEERSGQRPNSQAVTQANAIKQMSGPVYINMWHRNPSQTVGAYTPVQRGVQMPGVPTAPDINPSSAMVMYDPQFARLNKALGRLAMLNPLAPPYEKVELMPSQPTGTYETLGMRTPEPWFGRVRPFGRQRYYGPHLPSPVSFTGPLGLVQQQLTNFPPRPDTLMLNGERVFASLRQIPGVTQYQPKGRSGKPGEELDPVALAARYSASPVFGQAQVALEPEEIAAYMALTYEDESDPARLMFEKLIPDPGTGPKTFNRMADALRRMDYIRSNEGLKWQWAQIQRFMKGEKGLPGFIRQYMGGSEQLVDFSNDALIADADAAHQQGISFQDKLSPYPERITVQEYNEWAKLEDRLDTKGEDYLLPYDLTKDPDTGEYYYKYSAGVEEEGVHEPFGGAGYITEGARNRSAEAAIYGEAQSMAVGRRNRWSGIIANAPFWRNYMAGKLAKSRGGLGHKGSDGKWVSWIEELKGMSGNFALMNIMQEVQSLLGKAARPKGKKSTVIPMGVPDEQMAAIMDAEVKSTVSVSFDVESSPVEQLRKDAAYRLFGAPGSVTAKYIGGELIEGDSQTVKANFEVLSAPQKPQQVRPRASAPQQARPVATSPVVKAPVNTVSQIVRNMQQFVDETLPRSNASLVYDANIDIAYASPSMRRIRVGKKFMDDDFMQSQAMMDATYMPSVNKEIDARNRQLGYRRRVIVAHEMGHLVNANELSTQVSGLISKELVDKYNTATNKEMDAAGVTEEIKAYIISEALGYQQPHLRSIFGFSEEQISMLVEAARPAVEKMSYSNKADVFGFADNSRDDDRIRLFEHLGYTPDEIKNITSKYPDTVVPSGESNSESPREVLDASSASPGPQANAVASPPPVANVAANRPKPRAPRAPGGTPPVLPPEPPDISEPPEPPEPPDDYYDRRTTAGGQYGNRRPVSWKVGENIGFELVGQNFFDPEAIDELKLKNDGELTLEWMDEHPVTQRPAAKVMMGDRQVGWVPEELARRLHAQGTKPTIARIVSPEGHMNQGAKLMINPVAPERVREVTGQSIVEQINIPDENREEEFRPIIGPRLLNQKAYVAPKRGNQPPTAYGTIIASSGSGVSILTTPRGLVEADKYALSTPEDWSSTQEGEMPAYSGPGDTVRVTPLGEGKSRMEFEMLPQYGPPAPATPSTIQNLDPQAIAERATSRSAILNQAVRIPKRDNRSKRFRALQTQAVIEGKRADLGRYLEGSEEPDALSFQRPISQLEAQGVKEIGERTVLSSARVDDYRARATAAIAGSFENLPTYSGTAAVETLRVRLYEALNKIGDGIGKEIETESNAPESKNIDRAKKAVQGLVHSTISAVIRDVSSSLEAAGIEVSSDAQNPLLHRGVQRLYKSPRHGGKSGAAVLQDIVDKRKMGWEYIERMGGPDAMMEADTPWVVETNGAMYSGGGSGFGLGGGGTEPDGGSKRRDDGKGMWNKMGSVGQLLYGAYIGKRMYQMILAGAVDEANYYSERYMEPLAAVGAPAGASGANIGGAFGTAVRTRSNREWLARGGYEQFGGLSDMLYAISMGSGGGLPRMLAAGRLGGGIAATSATIGAMLPMAASYLAPKSALAGLATSAAPYIIGGGLVAGGIVLGGAAIAEGMNSLDINTTWTSPWVNEKGNRSMSYLPNSWGNWINRAMYTDKYSLAVGQMVSSGKRGEEWKEWRSEHPSKWYDINVGGMPLVYNVETREKLGFPNPTPEELRPYISDEEYYYFKGGLGMTEGMLAIEEAAKGITSITGEEFKQGATALRGIQNITGPITKGGRKDKILSAIERMYMTGGFSSAETAQTIEQIAQARGIKWGSQDAMSLIEELGNLKDFGELQELLGQTERTSQFGGMISGGFRSGRRGREFAAANAGQYQTLGEMGGFQAFEQTYQRFGIAMDDTALYEATGISSNKRLPGFIANMFRKPISWAEMFRRRNEQVGTYRSELEAQATASLQDMGMSGLDAFNSLDTLNIRNQAQAQVVQSVGNRYNVFGSTFNQNTMVAAMAGRTSFQTQQNMGIADILAQRSNMDWGAAFSMTAGLRLNNYEAGMLERVMGGDMSAISWMNRKTGGGNQWLGQAGMPIYQTDFSAFLNLGRTQQRAGNPYGATATMGGLAELGAVWGSGDQAAWSRGGAFGRELLYRQRMRGFDIQGQELQQAQLNRSITYTTTMWGLEDQQRRLGYTSQMADFAMAGQRSQLQNRYAMAFEGLQGQRLDQQEYFGNQQAAISWQRLQMSNQMGDRQAAMRLAGMNLSQNFQNWQLGFGRMQSLQSRQWTQEDWGYQDSSRMLSNAWSMEDINEQIRFSTGRQRRLLLRQRGRLATMQGMEEEQVETQRERQKTLWKQEDEHYQKQKEYLEEQMRLERESFNMQEEQRKALQALDVQQFNLNEQQRLALIALDRESYKLQVQQREEFFKLEQDELKRRMAEYKASYDIQDKMITEQRKFQQDQWKYQQEQLTLAKKIADETYRYQSQITAVTRSYELMAGYFQEIVKNDPSYAIGAFKDFAVAVKGISSSNLVQLNNVVSGFSRLNSFNLMWLYNVLSQF